MILQANGVETLNLVVSFVVALYESKFSEPSETKFLRFIAVMPLLMTKLQDSGPRERELIVNIREPRAKSLKAERS